MKVLFLCNKIPFPPKDGGTLAMQAMIDGLLKKKHSVKILAVDSYKQNILNEDIPLKYHQQTNIETVFLDLRIKPIAALKCFIANKSYHIERFISKKFENKLIEILKNETFDIVQFESVYMAPYLLCVKKHSNAKTILRTHNFEYLIWKRIAKKTKQVFKRFYLSHLTAMLEKYEKTIFSKFDGIIPISKKDLEQIKLYSEKTSIKAIPFGVDLSMYKLSDRGFEFPSIAHIGAMNWKPNLEGIKWFLEDVWPLVHSKLPNLKFYLAGRYMPEWLLQMQIPNVEIIGEVDDALDFIRSKAVQIVPILSGSGIRIKIIESMAAGRAVITTTIGGEGIKYSDTENIIIANSPQEFLTAITECSSNKKYCETIGNNARKLVELSFDNMKLIEELEAFYESFYF